MRLKILTAARGAGKTSFLREYVTREAAHGRSVGGIAAPAVFENGRRVGYDLLDLRCGSRRVLARVGCSADAAPTVGIYRFDDDAVAAGNEAISSAVRDRLDLIAIDEIGPLEFRGQGWAPALETALRECDPQQELVVVVRAALVDDLSKRFPSPAWTSASRVSPPGPASPRT